MFTLSAVLGLAIGLLSALLFKHVDLRRTPSLEFALLLVFAYIPYGFAEALSLSETSTFAYIGMAFFTIKLNFQPSLIFWCIVLCLVSRALNIFPISYAVNKCRREVQISMKNQIVLWFSGMRGAVCFALVLYMEVEKEKKSSADDTKTTRRDRTESGGGASKANFADNRKGGNVRHIASDSGQSATSVIVVRDRGCIGLTLD
ncbi:hypothetical protein TELCIR_10711 [Teladorsagia circumcincta]|uniref:Cation/H+ exchanger transmembrane domain-containing protein n=1 Tax=Teladorsagia circumcincta TaxID=45464 RepID=A0A2G9UBG9_TELCI|nr:hypothetical protein TELCIR_10711 [Teladorsagia circumcincta]